VTCLLKYIPDCSIRVYRSFQEGAHVTSKCNKLLCCVTLFSLLFATLNNVLAAVNFLRRGFWNPAGCTVCYKSQIQSGIM